MLRRFIPPAGRDRFARKIMAAMRAAGCAAGLAYDREEFCVRLASDAQGSVFWLNNAYRDYCHAPFWVRRKVIQQYARTFAVPAVEIPSSFAAARPHLLPRVTSRAYLELAPLYVLKHQPDLPKIPYRPITDHLAVAVAYDSDTSIAMVTQDNLTAWGVTLDEALAVSRDNLWRISNESFREVGPGVYASPWQDNHDAARLFLHDLVWQLKVAGDHIAVAPHRDLLLVTGSDNPAGLQTIADMSAALISDGRFISAIPVRLDGSTWKSYEPTGADAPSQALANLRTKCIAREYAEQQQFLQQRYARDGVTTSVSSVMEISDPATGRVWTAAVWPRGVVSALPRTDEVALDALAGSSQPLIVRWADCLALVGHHMVPQGLWPERYLVTEFPNAEEWAALEQVAIRKPGSPSPD